jgi:hypothetical protein
MVAHEGHVVNDNLQAERKIAWLRGKTSLETTKSCFAQHLS